MRTLHETKTGFTFIETLVTAGILLSLSLIATLWSTQSMDVWWTTNTQNEVRVHLQQALSRLTSDLRGGTRSGKCADFSVPAAPGNSANAADAGTTTVATFYLPTDVDGNGLITDANGNIEWGLPPANCPLPIDQINYTYVPAQRQLLRVQGAQQVVIAHDVQSVTVDDRSTDATLASNDARVTLTIQKTTPQGRTVLATSTAIVKLRN